MAIQKKKEVVESKNAKNAKKKLVVNNAPECCKEKMVLARMLTTTGSVKGMAWYCTKCQATKDK